MGEVTERVPVSPAFADVGLSVEEAEFMIRLLDDPTIPGAAGKEMPTADASVLLRRSKP